MPSGGIIVALLRTPHQIGQGVEHITSRGVIPAPSRLPTACHHGCPYNGDKLEIAVLAAHRGLGVGTALMSAAEQSARDLGAHRIHLDMLAENTCAQGFYRNLGYQTFGLLMGKLLTSS